MAKLVILKMIPYLFSNRIYAYAKAVTFFKRITLISKTLLIQVFMLVNFGYAQSFKNFIGPSPAAAVFAKYGDIPVSTYTGVPQIEIPLYTLQNHEIQLPITLSYHAGGFRVDEEAGRAGLGWTVNAGGIISRSVNGIDDFIPVRGYLNNSMPEFCDSVVVPALQRGENLLGSIDPNTYTVNIIGNAINMEPYLPASGDPEASAFDLEPDVFNYNFNGISGKFTIKKNKEIVKQSQDAISIKLLNNDGTSWQITTTEGIRYIFDKTERCRFQGSAGVFNEYITSWYLSKIISPTGSEIILTYIDNGSYNTVSYNHLNEKYIFEVIPLDTSPGNYLRPTPGAKTTSYPPIKSYNAVLLDSIIFPLGSLTFEYLNRIDLIGDKRLSKININNSSTPSASFSYELVQDYFTAATTSILIPDPVLNLDQNIFNKRLKLTSLVKRDHNGGNEQVYQFIYNNLNLPPKKSFARDHWGFYNGSSASTFLPNKSYMSYRINGQTVSYTSGADRKASSIYCKANVLKEIIYPTGGKTIFDFELNDYDVANSWNGFSEVSPLEIINDTLSFFTRRGFDETFNVSFPTVLSGSKIKFTITSQNGQGVSYPYPLSDDAFFEIYSADNLSVPVVRTLLGLESFWINEGNYYYRRDDQFSLPAGNYVIKTHFGSNVSFLNYIQFSFQFSYYLDNSLTHQIEDGGGLRVKTITNYDPVSNKSLIKNFSYHYNFDYDEDGIAEECSYGRRLSPLRYTTFERVSMCDPTGVENVTSVTYNLYSQSNMPNNQVIVGYDKVIIWEGTTKSNGYTEYEYHNTPSLELSYASNEFDLRPSGIPNLIDLNNGSLLKETDFIFESSSNSFHPIRETINTYESSNVVAQVGLRVMHSYAPNCPMVPGAGVFIAQYAALQSGWNRLASQTINEYVDPANPVSTIKVFKYEKGQPVHYSPIITTTTNSTGKKIWDIRIYPSDYANGNTAIDDMKAVNLVKPIEQVIFQENDGVKTILSGSIVNYKPGGKGLKAQELILETSRPVPLNSFKFSNCSSPGVLPLSGNNTAFDSDESYKQRSVYHDYDTKGNLLQYSLTGGPVVSLLWDYSYSYLTAEVNNASFTDIAYTGFDADEKGNWIYNGTINTDASYALSGSKYYAITGGISKSGLNSNTVYTLSYWQKGGVATVSGGTILTTITGHNYKGWTYIERTITGASMLNLTGGGYVDDVRLYPHDSQMTTYTYKPLVGMTSITDAKGQTTYYEYDNFQRLKSVKDSDGHVLKSFDYHYKP